MSFPGRYRKEKEADMGDRVYSTRICYAVKGQTKDCCVTGWKVDNTRARAMLAGLLEALRANPDSSFFVDVWEVDKSEVWEKMDYQIKASVVSPSAE